MTQRRIDINPFNAIGGLLILILLFWGVSLALGAVFKILTWLTPVMLIIAAVLDYKVITDYVAWIFKMLKENPLMGIAGIFLTIVGYPVVSGYLLGKAYLRSKIKNFRKQGEERQEGEFVEYEEIDEPFEKLDLPKEQPRRAEPIRRSRNSSTSNSDYEQLFDNE